MSTVNLFPSADAHVNQSNPTTNYGSSTNMEMSASKNIWLKFDLSSLPANCFITSATLHIGIYANVGAYGSITYGLKRASDVSWSEAGITWNNAPNSSLSPTTTDTLWNGTQTDVPPIGFQLDVTNDINDVMVESNTSVSWRIAGTATGAEELVSYSKESGQNTLYLVVNYVAGIVDTFTFTDTWTCPTGVTASDIYCGGAGGGGGDGGANPKLIRGGPGGGGGAFSKKYGHTVTPTTIYNVEVGIGGANGSGNNGGDTYFDTSGTVMAKGGVGGIAGSTSSVLGGSAGSGVGTVKYSGGASSGGSTDAGTGGGGAGTLIDGGSASGTTPGVGGNFFGGTGGAGNVGSPYGGGGSGGEWMDVGFNGADGVVLVHFIDPSAPTTNSNFMFMFS